MSDDSQSMSNAVKSSGGNDGPASAGSHPPLRAVNRPAVSPHRLAFEQAWEGWLPQAIVGTILAAGGLGYFLGYVGDLPVAMIVGAGLLLVPILLTGRHTTQMIDEDRLKSWIWLPLGGSAVVGLLCVAATLFPGTQIFSGTLSGVLPEITFPVPTDSRHVEVLVDGHLDTLGKASYDLVLEAPTHPIPLHGEVAKVTTTQRVGRRTMAGGPMDEGATRFVLDLDEAPTGLKLEHRDSMIKALIVHVRSIWIPAWLLTLLGISMILVSSGMDARIAGRYKQSYLTITTTFAVVMSLLYFHSATPDMFIRNLVGSALVGAIVGVVAGLTLVAVARKVLPSRWMLA